MTRGELTDPTYWDDVWTKASPIAPLSPADPDFGRNGTFTRMVRRHLGDLAGHRVLEVGGGGVNYRLLALSQWAGARVSAVDYSEVGLRVLADLFHRHGADVEVVFGDFLQLALPHADFDVIVHWGVLEHFSDPVPLLRSCRAAVRPGGRVLFSMPNLEAWAARGWSHYSPRNWSRHILHDEQTLRRACEAAGLEFVHGFYFGHPAAQMASWEHGGFVPDLLTLTQRVATVVTRGLPVALGSRRLSQYRGVLARVAQPEKT